MIPRKFTLSQKWSTYETDFCSKTKSHERQASSLQSITVLLRNVFREMNLLPCLFEGQGWKYKYNEKELIGRDFYVKKITSITLLSLRKSCAVIKYKWNEFLFISVQRNISRSFAFSRTRSSITTLSFFYTFSRWNKWSFRFGRYSPA